MNRIITFLAGLIASAASLNAQAQDNSLLWQITGNNLSKPSFLFGTIHLICPDDYIWTEKMKSSLDRAEKVCFELDLSDPDVNMQIVAGMTDNTNKKLPDYFSTEQYKLLSRFVKDSLNMDIALFEKMKPIMLEIFISATKINCTNPISYEDSIMKVAEAEGKKIMGLEVPKEQITDLEHIPVETVIKYLLEDIQTATKIDTEYRQLVNAYKQQDLPGLYSLITNSSDLENEKGPLLYDRNRKWTARIMDKMEVASVFFAVGAGHLYGPLGVIELLRKKGYKIEPIK